MNKKIPKNVIILGIVSFFNDLSSEMVYPIIPIFLTTVLKASVPVVGLVEGVAEATSSISKYVFGTLADYFKSRKPFVSVGYFLTAISKILIGLAQSWPTVLIGRFFDRTGKGIRTAPRDSILLENTQPHNKGFIFGFHRALDSIGAVFGPILALVFLYLLKENMRWIFFIAFVPSMIGVLLLIFFVKEKKHVIEKKKEFVKINFRALHPSLKLFLVASFIFSLGNSSDAFLILRARNLGFSVLLTTLSYVVYNIFYTVFSTPAGSLADKIGAKKVFGIGLLAFAVVYFFFGFIKHPVLIWVLFAVYGIYIAFTDGVSKAYVAEFIKKEESGSYFGFHQTLLGIGAFIASVVGGIIWNVIHPDATFYYGSLMAVLALLTFIVFSPKKQVI